MPADNPRILIESRDRCSWRAEYQPHAKTSDNFCFSEVRENFVDRPLTWRGSLAFGVAANTLHVLLNCLFHLVCPAWNVVHGPAFISRSSGFCHEYSG